MASLATNRSASIFAFGALLLLSLLAAFTPSAFPVADKPYDGIMVGNIAWMLVSTALVLLMTPGLAFFYGGMVSKENIISTMLQSFVALGVVSVVWYFVGFSLAFGDDWGGMGIIGNPATFFMFNNVGTAPHPTLGNGLPLVLFCAFQLKFAIITPALITGAFAERISFWGYVLFINLWIIFVYAPLAHMAWHPSGLLALKGVLDFAGGTVVHISAGCAALAGAMFLGRRKSTEGSLPANIPFVILGTGLLWFGWFGFNGGSALAANEQAVKAFVNTNLAAAIAGITWIMLDTVRGKKPSALGACIGAVVGLVAITPACGYISYGPSLFIGAIAAIVSNYAAEYFKSSKLDDTLDVFACHGLGGITGMICTAIFATPDYWAKTSAGVASHSLLLMQHAIALSIVVPFAFGVSYAIYKVVDMVAPLRVGAEAEIQGLDISQHNESFVQQPFAWSEV